MILDKKKDYDANHFWFIKFMLILLQKTYRKGIFVRIRQLNY